MYADFFFAKFVSGCFIQFFTPNVYFYFTGVPRKFIVSHSVSTGIKNSKNAALDNP